MEYNIRWMIRRDMAEVLAIEKHCFEFPWLEEDFIRCLRQRNCIGMVAEVRNYCTCAKPKCTCPAPPILGFMLYELHKTRLHVLSFAVHQDRRFDGIGAAMMAKLVSRLSTTRRNRITLEVRETNLGAQLFFKLQGFRAIQVMRNFYEDSPEDAYLMEYRIREGVVA